MLYVMRSRGPGVFVSIDWSLSSLSFVLGSICRLNAREPLNKVPVIKEEEDVGT